VVVAIQRWLWPLSIEEIMSRICAVVRGRKIFFSCPNDFLGTYIVAPVHVVHPVC
jgi:hypothetical protein